MCARAGTRPECLIGYHLTPEGRAIVQFGGGTEVSLAAGDVVIILHLDELIARWSHWNTKILSGRCK
jgi:hypothetical protein